MRQSIKYETVAASATAQALGATGSTGDFIQRLIIIPATVSPGTVALLDGTTSISILTGGANSLTEIKPIVVELGMRSTVGAWKVTTGTAVSCIGVGLFS